MGFICHKCNHTHGAVLILQSFTSNASAKHAHSIVSPTKVRVNGTRLLVVADQSVVHLSCNVSVETHAALIFPAALGMEQLQNPVKSAKEYTCT